MYNILFEARQRGIDALRKSIFLIKSSFHDLWSIRIGKINFENSGEIIL
jgi:hypothetical protein